MSYISTATDITDKMVKDFITANDARLTYWLSKVDNEIDLMARRYNLQPSEVYGAGAGEAYHPKIVELGAALFGKYCCWDNRYVNAVEGIEDKYSKSYFEYAALVDALKGELTKDMFRDEESLVDGEETIGYGTILIRG